MNTINNPLYINKRIEQQSSLSRAIMNEQVLKVFAESLAEGSPEVYKNFADKYDEFFNTLNYCGTTNTVGVWQRYHPNILGDGTVHNVLDAGCGTGLVGEAIFKLYGHCNLLNVYGGDLSPDMLEKAKTKNVYGDLKIVNLKEQLPYQPEFFDSIISSGTFLQGHCGPECIPNIIRVLKRNCYFVTTVRTKFYEETKSEWERQIKECGCELIEKTEIQYHDMAKGLVLIIKKN